MSKMTEEELQTKVFYSLGQAEVSSSERVLKIGDELMQAIHSYTQEKCREVELKAQLGMIDYYDQAPTNESCNWKGLLSDNRKQIEYELAQLNKSKGE